MRLFTAEIPRHVVLSVFLLLNNYITCEAKTLTLDYLLQPSLFSKVPPFLKFQSLLNKVSVLPDPEIRRYLLWPAVSRRRKELLEGTLLGSGHLIVPKNHVAQSIPKLMGWIKLGKSLRKFASQLQSYQKVAAFPGMNSEVSYRDGMWINLKKFMQKHPKLSMPFVLPAFILPDGMDHFRTAWENTKDKLWIRKLPKSSLSLGLQMLGHWKDLKSPMVEKSLVQKYVHNPILYNNIKVEFKLTFLVTSVHPLRIYSHPGTHVLALSTSNYSTQPEDVHDLCIHSRIEDMVKCDSFSGSNKISDDGYSDMMATIHEKYDLNKLLFYMDQAVILTLLSAEKPLSKAFYKKARNRYNYFQILTADFIVDENGQPWLMEVNGSPFRTVSKAWVKSRNHDFYSEILNIVGYHLPPHIGAQAKALIRNQLGYTNNLSKVVLDEELYQIKLNADEVQKQLTFANITDRQSYLNSILDNLTGADVRMLMICEDELNRVRVGKRVFPTRSIAGYIPLIESNTYYYKLLDTWESKYGHNRSAGRILLKKLSQKIM